MNLLQQNKKTELLDVDVTDINIAQIIHLICEKARLNSEKTLINYINVHGYYLSFFDQEYKKVLNQSDIVFCDGFGVKVGAWLLNKKIGQRMCPPDWIDPLLEKCAREKISVFFLGDQPGTIELFREKISSKFPSLDIRGAYHGFFNKQNDENIAILDIINNSGADLLLVGMGMPLQEKWTHANLENINARVILGVGGTFHWYTGVGKRGPQFVTNNGFEWLWRLLVEPKKVWKRYLIELPYFFYVVLKKKFQPKQTTKSLQTGQ
jgi:N-acetylglucosaminyldiphosphoundecaprenol N-acetyl-beta-D-mannosaminyltransferase